MTTEPIALRQSLAEIAMSRAGAARVFHRHGLDFCCHGGTSLEAACAAKGIAGEALLAEIEAASAEAVGDFEPWHERPVPELIEHILQRFHAPLREELPRLREMARKVEDVHRDKASCPRGLGEQIERLGEELEQHMQKEEQVLFPLALAGRGQMAGMPIQIMEQEHEDAALLLQGLRGLAHDYAAPDEACATWRALYAGLSELELDLMLHIHLENNVLFPLILGR